MPLVAAALAALAVGTGEPPVSPRPGDITTGSMVVFSPVAQPLGATEWSLGGGYALAVPSGAVGPRAFPVVGFVGRVAESLEISALISPNSILGFRVPHEQHHFRSVGSGFELQAQLDPRLLPEGGVQVPATGTANLGAQYVLETVQRVGPLLVYAMPQAGYYTRGPLLGTGLAFDLDLGPVIIGAGANLRFWYDGKSGGFVPDQRLGAGGRLVLSDRMFVMAAYNAFVPEGTQATLVGVGYRFGDLPARVAPRL